MAGEIGKPLGVGPLTLPNRVFLAPMSGVTDAPFRRLAAKLGAVVVSEMIASAALAEGRRDQQRRLVGEGLPLNIVQLAGCEAHWMAEGARIAEGAGADIIDINMGCPVPKITKCDAGAKWLLDPQKI
jgi:tRNA-dihydrouridine synthase B